MSVEYTCALRSTDAAGVLYVNTFALKSDPTGPDVEEMTDQEVVDGVYDWLHTSYRALLSTDYTWQDIVCRGILGHDGEALHVVGEAGTFPREPGGSFQLPREVCCILTLKTAHVGRSGRGHVALPSPDDAAQLASNSSWKTGAGTYFAACQAFGDALLAGHDVDGGDARHAHLSARLWSRKHAVTYDLVSAQARPPVRWLRSRSTAP